MTRETIYCACTVTQIDPECPTNGAHRRAPPQRFFRFYYEPRGGHVHVRVFAGKARDGTLGKLGDMTFDLEDWRAFRFMLVYAEGIGEVEFVEEKP